MSIKSEWCNFVNKIMWIWVWDSQKRKQLRLSPALIKGKNNRIIIFSDDNDDIKRKKVPGLYINIKGSNNLIKIASNVKFNNCALSITANNTSVFIDKNSYYNSLVINMICGNGQKIELGKNITAHGVTVNLNEENAALIVKDNCLFSNSISIWPTDGHSIFDKQTKTRINHIKHPVEIGEHCWIGEGVKITKNAKLPPNSIVGIGAVVTKEFTEENTIIAGNPARVIKKDILWNTRLNHKY